MPPGSPDLKAWAMFYIKNGSQAERRSQFLHASTTFAASIVWRGMAGRDNRTKQRGQTVRISLQEMFANGDVAPSQVFNVSTLEHQLRWIGGGERRSADYYGMDFQDALPDMRKNSSRAKEILIQWRGTVPIWAFEVLDPDTGSVIGPLQNVLEKVRPIGFGTHFGSQALGAAAKSGGRSHAPPRKQPPPPPRKQLSAPPPKAPSQDSPPQPAQPAPLPPPDYRTCPE